jgi:uncharacterized protein
MKPISLCIAEELGVREQQVAAAISLLDGGATVPFVARYRKEATGALDDAQLRTLEERLRYLRELDERRAAILDSISQQGKLDAALKHAIDAADTKARLEDLYLPYRPKRRTKAQIAREAGLEPLAEALLARPDQSPEQMARRFVEPSKGVIDSTAALEGARAILIERFTEDATLVGSLREEVWSRGHLRSRVRAGKAEAGVKFTDYFEFSEPLAKLPSHRILALFRGEKEEVLSLELVPDPGSPDRGEPSGRMLPTADRTHLGRRNALLIWRGTGSSNPALSPGESAANSVEVQMSAGKEPRGKSQRMRDSAVMISSTMPSTKYSCSGVAAHIGER